MSVESIIRASTDASGDEANGTSRHASISADGRYVAFQSLASNLVPGDPGGEYAVYVKDLETGEIHSTRTDPGQNLGPDSTFPDISADGRYVAFVSGPPAEENFGRRVWVWDLETGAIVRANNDASDNEANYDSGSPSISADGRQIAFDSGASSLVSGDTNGYTDIFVKDLETGAITRASTDASGNEANYHSADPSISADGRYVAFESRASNLVPGDNNGEPDIFVKDLETGAIVRANTDVSGNEANNYSWGPPSISADGRYVAFRSDASNLVSGGGDNVLVKDLVTGAIVLANTDASGNEANGRSNDPSISADGRYVAFWSEAPNLVPGDTNGHTDIFVKDLQTEAITRASMGTFGNEVNDWSRNASISADGRYVAFESRASDLVPDDTNDFRDVFVATLDLTDLPVSAINGTDSDDTITPYYASPGVSGTPGDGQDLIYGHGGNDGVQGGEGNDIIYGGSDNDTVSGGRGEDIRPHSDAPGLRILDHHQHSAC